MKQNKNKKYQFSKLAILCFKWEKLLEISLTRAAQELKNEDQNEDQRIFFSFSFYLKGDVPTEPHTYPVGAILIV